MIKLYMGILIHLEIGYGCTALQSPEGVAESFIARGRAPLQF